MVVWILNYDTVAKTIKKIFNNNLALAMLSIRVAPITHQSRTFLPKISLKQFTPFRSVPLPNFYTYTT